MLLPIRHRSIFRSRWIALVWAVGIIWTALDVSSPDPPENAIEQSAGNMATAALPPDQQNAIELLRNWGG